MPKSFLPILFADNGTDAVDIFWTNLFHGFIGSLVFGFTGIILIVLGFKIFDWMNTKIDIQHELTEKQNIAVAVVCAGMIIGVAIIAAVAVK